MNLTDPVQTMIEPQNQADPQREKCAGCSRPIRKSLLMGYFLVDSAPGREPQVTRWPMCPGCAWDTWQHTHAEEGNQAQLEVHFGAVLDLGARVAWEDGWTALDREVHAEAVTIAKALLGRHYVEERLTVGCTNGPIPSVGLVRGGTRQRMETA